MALTLCTVLAFVANRAHAVPIGAGAVPAAKRVYTLRDRDVTLGAFPAAVAHTGALVVLAVAAAQHWARRWREKKKKNEERLHPVQKKKKRLSESHNARPHASTPYLCSRVNRVVKGLENANDIKSNYR